MLNCDKKGNFKMMSTDELYDQINADEKVILDSIGTDEKGWPTPPMAPLEVLVRYTVFGEVYGLIDDDYFNIHTYRHACLLGVRKRRRARQARSRMH